MGPINKANHNATNTIDEHIGTKSDTLKSSGTLYGSDTAAIFLKNRLSEAFEGQRNATNYVVAQMPK